MYRVQALPQSILPLVWDFGQLNFEVESLYITQMVHRCVSDNHYDTSHMCVACVQLKVS